MIHVSYRSYWCIGDGIDRIVGLNDSIDLIFGVSDGIDPILCVRYRIDWLLHLFTIHDIIDQNIYYLSMNVIK